MELLYGVLNTSKEALLLMHIAVPWAQPYTLTTAQQVDFWDFGGKDSG